jgi:membrane peptidoglycan carboxypeptidase
MLMVLRALTRLAELVLLVPVRLAAFVVDRIAFNPRLGPVRYVALAGIGYVVFALLLVYVLAPLRGWTGQFFLADQLRYDAERWVATAIYDRSGSFVGTFDPRLDSMRDVNYTESAIELGSHTANPDHKSIPVREVPPAYWNCLKYHEDRYLGGPLNPYGIDLVGVLKIPYSSLKRTIATRRPSLGVGGSTLPMQFARVVYNTPPSASEGGFTKLRRKIAEWWIAPVIYQVLTASGDDTPLKQWAANHIWLAQRTGGAPLHGVEMTARVVFGKEGQDLSVAEQFVLASAVNKPIILLEGSEKLNEVRLDRWRYITEVRARTCAEKLITDEAEQKKVVFELIQLAGGPPDPKVKPKLQAALDTYAPTIAKRAVANPMVRAQALMPSARFGLREEMKQLYGFSWRDYVRGVTTTVDVTENLKFGETVKTRLATLDAQYAARLGAGYTLDPAKAAPGKRLPNVILIAANARGEIVRYFEAGESASYFGSPSARDAATGVYAAERESRMLASTGKILAAVAIANEGRDEPGTLYADSDAPSSNPGEGCGHGGGQRAQRRAIVAFACSLNAPLLTRTAAIGQARIRHLIDRFGFNMPPANANGEGTPPSTATVLGQIAGSPRRVHQMSSVVLASLIGQGGKPVHLPSLIKTLDYTNRADAVTAQRDTVQDIVPNVLIKTSARGMIKALLEAPLCHTAGGQPAGTLKSIAQWCAARRPGMRLHFAKTGTKPTLDPNATVDTWITGGVQFSNGAAYSYVALVGTGSVTQPWATNMNAARITPLVDALLLDLEGHAKSNPAMYLLPPKPAVAVPVAAAPGKGGIKPLAADERARVFGEVR